MTYTLKWHPQAYKILEKLPQEIIKRVTGNIEVFDHRSKVYNK